MAKANKVFLSSPIPQSSLLKAAAAAAAAAASVDFLKPDFHYCKVDEISSIWNSLLKKAYIW